MVCWPLYLFLCIMQAFSIGYASNGGIMTRSTQTIVLAFSPELAAQVGLNEAILISQMTYWLSKTKHIIKGKPWVYNSYDAWEIQFPFWSKSTIRRLISSLEEKGVLISQNLNVRKTNRTKWYSLDLDKIPASHSQKQFSQRKEETLPSAQDEHSHVLTLNTSIKDSKNPLQRMKERVVGKFANFKPARNIDDCKNKKVLEAWSLSDEERLKTSQQLSWDEDRIDNELLRFRAYYANKIPSAKKDWNTVWQMWCTRAQSFAMERHKRQNSGKEGTFTKQSSDNFIQKIVQERDREHELKKALEQTFEKEFYQGLRKNHLTQSAEKDENILESQKDVWLNVSKSLIKQVGAGAYTSWLKDAQLETVKDDSVVIKVKNRFSADYISIHLLDKIRNAFESALSVGVNVSIVV